MEPEILAPDAAADVAKVACSYCGEGMDCPKSMLKEGMKHICQFCTDVMDEGMTDEQIKEASLEERKLSPYYRHVEEMTAAVLFAYPPPKGIRGLLKEMGKMDIAEDFFIRGITSAFDMILHEAGPETLLKIKESPVFSELSAEAKTVMEKVKGMDEKQTEAFLRQRKFGAKP